MVEFLLLLLPVAAASGWLAAKRSEKRREAAALEREQNPAYFNFGDLQSAISYGKSSARSTNGCPMTSFENVKLRFIITTYI